MEVGVYSLQIRTGGHRKASRLRSPTGSCSVSHLMDRAQRWLVQWLVLNQEGVLAWMAGKRWIESARLESRGPTEGGTSQSPNSTSFFFFPALSPPGPMRRLLEVVKGEFVPDLQSTPPSWRYLETPWRTGPPWTRTGFLGGSDSKESVCSAEDQGLIPGSGRAPREGNGYLLQYSCLENSMDRGAWRATHPMGSGRKELDSTEQLTLTFTHFMD